MADHEARPVVLIPGTLGTTLVDPITGRTVWGSLLSSVIDTLCVRRAPHEREALRPGAVLWSYVVLPAIHKVDVYRGLARELGKRGYRLGDPIAPNESQALYPFSYDWRTDIVAAARALEEMVQRVCERTGAEQVDLVGHSWGCSVARYFLLFGGADVLVTPPEEARPGAGKVHTLFSVAPTSGGTVSAYRDLKEGFAPTGRLGMRFESDEIGRWPSVYQMLPSETDIVVDGHGRRTDDELSDISFWKQHGLGPYADGTDAGTDETVSAHLARSARLATALSERCCENSNLRFITYTCDSIPTLGKVVVDTSGRRSRLVLDPREVRERYPEAAEVSLVPGDEYAPFVQVCRAAEGADVVRDERNVSDRSFVLVARAKRHRWLVRSPAVLTNIALNIQP